MFYVCTSWPKAAYPINVFRLKSLGQKKKERVRALLALLVVKMMSKLKEDEDETNDIKKTSWEKGELLEPGK